MPAASGGTTCSTTGSAVRQGLRREECLPLVLDGSGQRVQFAQLLLARLLTRLFGILAIAPREHCCRIPAGGDAAIDGTQHPLAHRALQQPGVGSLRDTNASVTELLGNDFDRYAAIQQVA